ncbi:protein of unknown function [Actinacidiphila yanglinensis]|uniref:DUF4132 domain-containing protein n=1 Tax=Actinacidiphila yanglinensis TaxID=310779 RepID=A0A1H5XK02_9ACTN|nr:DUF4132 domain-containing protein [Actinacidiphila yanglinensis]SEG11556.1 protein of unknown function [Actinacidiphila yanglinensis]
MIRRWYGLLAGGTFPRTLNGPTNDPLEPRRLGRALRRAAALDERNIARALSEKRNRPVTRGEKLLARLPEAERRRIALRLQEERRGLEALDQEVVVGEALARIHCGWSAAETHRLFRLATRSSRADHPPRWTFWSAQCLELPLAALGELRTSEHAAFAPYLRVALAARLGCHAVVVAGLPQDAMEAYNERLRRPLGLPYNVDELLPPADPFAASVRCALGPDLYLPPALALVDACARLTEVRPTYAWLGRTRELLQSSPRAAGLLVPMLRAARGEPLDCTDARRHRGEFGEPSGRLLVGLAWAACMSDDSAVVRELGDSLLAVDRDLSGEGAAFFLRGGIAALAALAGEPAVGRHRRALGDPPAHVQGAARELLQQMWHLLVPGGVRALDVPVGEYLAIFRIGSDGSVELLFRNAAGRLLSRTPSKVRQRDPALHGALRARLTALRDEVTTYRGLLAERLHGDPGRPAGSWSAAHLDDPLFEPLTRALVWEADTPEGPVLGMPARRGRSSAWVLRDLRGRFHKLTETTSVRLWDPATSDAAEVSAWASAVRRRGLRQPVPQLPG